MLLFSSVKNNNEDWRQEWKGVRDEKIVLKKLCCIILLATLLFAFTGCADLDEILDDEPTGPYIQEFL